MVLAVDPNDRLLVLRLLLIHATETHLRTVYL